MKFAKVVFWIAGIWGLVVLTPLYFMFDAIGRKAPPAITHPQFYFGFVGLALVWQIVFIMIAREPVRFRPLMLVAVLEKLSYIVVVLLLHFEHRLDPGQMFFCGTDTVLCLLFVAAFVKTRKLAD